MKTKSDRACQTAGGKFTRVNYYHGLLLTEEDFRVEQAYFTEKLKLHNRLHGFGIVWGLCVELPEETDPCLGIPEGTEHVAVLRAGYALDRCGHDIVVCKDQAIILDRWIEDLCRGCPPEKISNATDSEDVTVQAETECDDPAALPRKLYIALCYDECYAEPREQYITDCDQRPQRQYTRVREGYRIDILAEDEVGCCGGVPECKGKTCGCEGKCDCRCGGCPGIDCQCCGSACLVIGCIEVICRDPDTCETKIRLCDGFKPPYALAVSTPCGNWERAQQALLRAACCRGDWVDVSVVIGKPTRVGLSMLQGMLGLEQDLEVIPCSEVSQEMLCKIACATPCVEKGTQVVVITDEEYQCVLFLLPLQQYVRNEKRYKSVPPSAEAVKATLALKKKSPAKKKSAKKRS